MCISNCGCGDVTNVLSALWNIVFNEVWIPVQPMSYLFDMQPGIMQGNRHCDSIGVCHNTKNMKAHIVLRIQMRCLIGPQHQQDYLAPLDPCVCTLCVNVINTQRLI